VDLIKSDFAEWFCFLEWSSSKLGMGVRKETAFGNYMVLDLNLFHTRSTHKL